MKIGLVDVDGHNFPNFALMKLASYHRSKGNSVEWANPLFGHYDMICKSKIFTFSPDDDTHYSCEVLKGGTGYDIRSRLPQEWRTIPEWIIHSIRNILSAFSSSAGDASGIVPSALCMKRKV